MTAKFFVPRCLGPLLALLWLGLSPQLLAQGPLDLPYESYVYNVMDAQGQDTGGRVTTEIKRDGALIVLHETRRMPKDIEVQIELILAAKTHTLIRWKRMARQGKTHMQTSIRLVDGVLYLQHQDPDGALHKDHLNAPKTAYAVTPLMKFFIAGFLSRDQKPPQKFLFVVVKKDKLSVYEIGLKKLGQGLAGGGALKGPCQRFEMQPTSLLLSAAVPPGTMCFANPPMGTDAADWSWPMLEAYGSLHRLADPLRTVLVKYDRRGESLDSVTP